MPSTWSVYSAAPHRVLFLPGFIQGVALLRMAADYFPASGYDHLVALAGLLWLAVFSAWAWIYAPMTWRCRIDGKSG